MHSEVMKTVLITGAAGGIGRAIAHAYADLGKRLILIDHNKRALKELADLLEKQVEVLAIECDVSEFKEVEKSFEIIDQEKWEVDILINNVGVGRSNDFLSLSVEDFDYVYRTNLRSVMLYSQYCGRHMKMNGTGRIVNIASTRALMSEPGTEAYSASKGGIVSLTHALAMSLGPYDITVNAISPGWIHTGPLSELSVQDHLQHPSGRVGNVEDIAKACLFLTSESNDFITGENLVIDGGMTKKMIYEE